MFAKIIVVLCFGAVLGFPSAPISDTANRVVNGTDADINDWPFMVSLQNNNRHFCGGTAIAPFWVMTAAHCVVDNTNHSAITVVHGTSDKSRYENHTIRGVEVFSHVNYNPSNTYIHDIALLRLSSPLNILRFSLLPNQFDGIAQGTPATLLGWGDTLETNRTDILQKADLIVFSNQICSERHNRTIHQSNICGGVPEGGRGQCSGDSGGPLITFGIQVGIVSWSVKPCAVYPYPGVYTQVSYYREWIRQISGI